MPEQHKSVCGRRHRRVCNTPTPLHSLTLNSGSNNSLVSSLCTQRRPQHWWPRDGQRNATHHTPGQTSVTTASPLLRHKRRLQNQRVIHVPPGRTSRCTPPGHSGSPCSLRAPCLPPPEDAAQAETAAECQRGDEGEQEQGDRARLVVLVVPVTAGSGTCLARGSVVALAHSKRVLCHGPCRCVLQGAPRRETGH
jgi:hypothetical protein